MSKGQSSNYTINTKENKRRYSLLEFARTYLEEELTKEVKNFEFNIKFDAKLDEDGQVRVLHTSVKKVKHVEST